jgi:hypothetical protein
VSERDWTPLQKFLTDLEALIDELPDLVTIEVAADITRRKFADRLFRLRSGPPVEVDALIAEAEDFLREAAE